MNLEKQNKSDDDIKKNKFTANNRYFTICIYTMFVIFFGAIIINLITSWNTTLKNIEKGLTVLMPFIIGALIAYILNPAVARFYKLFRDKCKIKSDALCKILAIITAYVDRTFRCYPADYHQFDGSGQFYSDCGTAALSFL